MKDYLFDSETAAPHDRCETQDDFFTAEALSSRRGK
jgi:hypothetical protein